MKLETGSPPQVRGKRKRGTNDGKSKRITPAGAGKTSLPDCVGMEKEDHPRRCGENVVKTENKIVVPGSPPQVRGKRSILRIGREPPRITPAGAGKTLSRSSSMYAQKDHPRRCGENWKLDLENAWEAGSPPQVRGKRLHIFLVYFLQRITPAGAGKTPTRTDMTAQREDHPRRCGENGIPLYPCRLP